MSSNKVINKKSKQVNNLRKYNLGSDYKLLSSLQQTARNYLKKLINSITNKYSRVFFLMMFGYLHNISGSSKKNGRLNAGCYKASLIINTYKTKERRKNTLKDHPFLLLNYKLMMKFNHSCTSKEDCKNIYYVKSKVCKKKRLITNLYVNHCNKFEHQMTRINILGLA